LKLLIDARKLKLSEKDFHAQIKVLTDLKDDQIETLWKFDENSIDKFITGNDYSFRDLEWRLEAKVRLICDYIYLSKIVN
jgi:hypothetical protein